MNKKAITVQCFGSELQDTISRLLTSASLSGEEKREQGQLLNKIPTCPHKLIRIQEVDIVTDKGEKKVKREEKTKEKKSKRGKSPYNKFISDCMKKEIGEGSEPSSAMKTCATRWKKNKKELEEQYSQ